MAINKIMVTDRDKLLELYNDSALTLEGLAEDSIPDFVEWIKKFTPLKTEDVYIIKGGIMNMAYNLTGTNAYANDLTIVCVKLSDMEDAMKIVLPRFEIGGRWFDDVVDNNKRHQEERMEVVY